MQLAATTTKRLLQQAEIGAAGFVEHDRLAVQNKAVGVELGRSSGNRRKALGPIEAAAGEDANASLVTMYGKTIAIPFYLEKPIRACWRFGLQQSQARLDPGWILSANRSRSGAPRRAVTGALLSTSPAGAALRTRRGLAILNTTRTQQN
jgi:hypothetical protein